MTLSQTNKKNTTMEKVKVIVEIADCGFSAYMADNSLDYSCIGEGPTVKETVEDFKKSYEGMKDYFAETGRPFKEVEFDFRFDTASFLEEYSGVFSLSGLERITGVNQTQLGHYLHGRHKPSRRTVERIQKGVEEFTKELSAFKFA